MDQDNDSESHSSKGHSVNNESGAKNTRLPINSAWDRKNGDLTEPPKEVVPPSTSEEVPPSTSEEVPSDPDLMTMKIKVPHPKPEPQAVSEPTLGQSPEMMTMRVKVPRPPGQAPQRSSMANAPGLMTMRIKVPRISSSDPACVGAAVASNLQTLDQSTTSPATARTISGPAHDLTATTKSQGSDQSTPFIAEAPPKIGRELNLRDIFFMVRERWVLGLALGVLFSGAYAFWQLTQPKVYRGEAEILVEAQPDRILPEDLQNVDEDFASFQGKAMEQAMQIHDKNLESVGFKELVKSSFGLSEVSAYANPLFGQDEAPSPLACAQLFDNHFGEGLSVTRKSQAQFILVAYEHPDPEIAQQVTNRYAEKYDEFIKKDNSETHRQAQAFLDARITDLKQEIEQQERAILEYRKEFGLVGDEDMENASPEVISLGQQIMSADTKIVDLELQLKRIESLGQDVAQQVDLPVIASFGRIADLKTQLAENAKDRARLEIKYLSRHPKIIENQGTRKVILGLLESTAEMAVKEAMNQLAETKIQREKLDERLTQAADTHLAASDPIIEYRVMQKRLQMEQNQHDMLLQRRSDTHIVSLLDGARVKVIQPALVPTEPITPDRRKIMKSSIMILFAGLFLVPVGIGFLDTRLKSFSEAEAFLGKECLGAIGEKKKMKPMELGQCVANELDEEVMEAFRVIYTTMELHSQVPAPKVILTTSTGPSEGKSFITANLAATFSRHGNRVLIIDLDLRKPSQHKLCGLRNTHGIVKWFQSPQRVIPRTGQELVQEPNLGLAALKEGHLYLLRAGGSTRNPSEILASKDFESLFNSLRNMFDFIFIDTPPVGLFPDALLTSHHAEEALFVCKHNDINRHKIKFALTKLDRSGTQVLGTVMNQMSASRRHQYGYGYRDYGYQYYGQKDYAKYYHDEDEADEVDEDDFAR